MNSNSPQDALRSRWTLEGKIPLARVADGAAWHRARSRVTGQALALFVVQNEASLEAADAVRRAFLIEDPRLVPVLDIHVFGDPRETVDDPQAVPSAGDASRDAGAEAPSPMTVVEYPLPTVPPLAAMLSSGPLHPETARSIIGEAATGLEVARRRGVRHQFLDSNRVFVDTASGEVSVLGLGVEAASHPGWDRSRPVASFQDAAALAALLFRALTGRAPRPGADGRVPLASQLAPGPVPEDLDLLCDLVLNADFHGDEDVPETTRAVIEALDPWQSIPVTLEAYERPVAGAAPAPASTPSPAPAPSPAPTGDDAAQEAAEADPVPVAGTAAGDHSAAGPGAAGIAAAAAGAAGVAGIAAAHRSETDDDSTLRMDAVPSAATPDPEQTQTLSSDQELPSEPAASTPQEPSTPQGPSTPQDSGPQQGSREALEPDLEDTVVRSIPPVAESSAPEHSPESIAALPPAAAADRTPDSSTSARAETGRRAQELVQELQLDEKRGSSAFPGHLDITLPRRPQPDPSPASSDAGWAPSDSAAPADPAAPSATATSAGAVGAGAAGAAAASAATTPPAAPGAPGDIPARRSGTHWPLSSQPEDQPAATSAGAPAPASPAPAAPSPAAPRPAGVQASAPTPAVDSAAPSSADAATESHAPGGERTSPVHHQPGHRYGTVPLPVAGRTDSLAPTPAEEQDPSGPIVVRGRNRSALDDGPVEVTQPVHRSALLRDVVGVAVDSEDAPSFSLGTVQPAERSRQSQWILIGAALLVILALVFALTTITSGLRERIDNPLNTSPVAAPTETTAEPQPAEEPTEEPTEEEPELPAAQLADVSLSVHGADGGPDNEDQLGRMTDGDPGTFWSSQHYASAHFGGLKDAIEVRVDLAEPSTLTAVVLTTARNTGGTIEMRPVNEDGSLGDTVATGAFAGDGEVRLAPEEPVATAAVALVITELPPDSNEAGRFRGRIAEIRVE